MPSKTSRMTANLFENAAEEPHAEPLVAGAVILRKFARCDETAILAAIRQVVAKARFRQMITPGGYQMSVAMTNCGTLGWVTDRGGYRYDSNDPVSRLPWPAMPEPLLKLGTTAANEGGFRGFAPDACLINRYETGARLSLHQDRDEKDFSHPIVSVSLGIPAVFLFGGLNRNDKTIRVRLTHGDVVVWGGPARLRYHGVLALKQDQHPLVGDHRINLTFRKAG